MVFNLNQYFFIKATKAAGQSRLSKFEAVECSNLREHSSLDFVNFALNM